MRQLQHISHGQVVLLTIIAIYGLNAYVLRASSPASWLTIIAGILLLIPPALWLLHLADRHRGKTILEIVEITAGKPVSWLFNAVYILIAIALAVCMLNFYAHMIQVYFLSSTPTWVIMTIVSLLSFSIAKSGLEVLGRLSFILTNLAVLNFFIGNMMGLGLLQMENITPVFFDSPFQLIKEVYLQVGLVMECLLFIMVFTPALPRPAKYYRAVAAGLAIASVITGFGVLFIIGILGAGQAGSIAFVTFNITQSIQIGTFIQGMEIFIMAAFAVVAYLKTSVYFYSAATAGIQIFNHRRPQLIRWILFAAVSGAAIWVNSYTTAYDLAIMLAKYIIPPYALLALILATAGSWVKKSA